jgi:flap endonuclease-1
VEGSPGKGDVEKVRLYSQAAGRLTEEMKEEAKKLLSLMGISWVQAPSEGEAQAAHMMEQGLCWAVGSQDWDSLLFGAGRMVKNLAISGRRKVPRKEKYVTVSRR